MAIPAGGKARVPRFHHAHTAESRGTSASADSTTTPTTIRRGPHSGDSFKLSLEDQYRFLIKIKVDLFTGCWEWLGSHDQAGYGQFCYNKNTRLAHRASWLLYKGPIAEGLVVDHLCRNKGCCNPDHLELVTQVENTKRFWDNNASNKG